MQKKQEKSIKRRIKNTAITVALIIAVLLCLYISIQVMTRGHANLFGFSLFRVVTGSMEPTIPVGSLLVSQRADIEDIAVGDIVCFYSKDSHLLGKIITHRVIEVLSDAGGNILLQTQGDANVVADFQYVAEDNLIGKVIYYAGEGNLLAAIMSFFTTRIGFLGCIVFPCLIIAGVILKDCVKNIRGELHQIMDELDQEDGQQAQETVELSPEEREQMEAQIRAELTAELTKEQELPKEQSEEQTEESVAEPTEELK